MNPNTTDTARKAIRYLKARVGTERLTAGSLPNDTGMVLAVRASAPTRPPNSSDYEDSANGNTNGKSANGYGNENGSAPGSGSGQQQLQALLIIADEEADKAPLYTALYDGTPIGPAGEVVGESTRTGVLSWQPENKEADGTLTESYVTSLAAELIREPPAHTAPPERDHTIAEDQRPAEDSHHRTRTNGQPGPATVLPAQSPADNTEQTGEPETTTPAADREEQTPQEQASTQDSSDADAADDELSSHAQQRAGPDHAPAGEPEPGQTSVTVSDDKPSTTADEHDEGQPHPEHPSGPTGADGSLSGHNPIPEHADADSAAASRFVLKEQNSQAEEPQSSRDDAACSGYRQKSSTVEERAVEAPPYDNGHHDDVHDGAPDSAPGSAAPDTGEVWRMLQNGAASAAGAAYSPDIPANQEPEHTTADEPQTETTGPDTSTLAGPDADTAELPAYDPDSSYSETHSHGNTPDTGTRQNDSSQPQPETVHNESAPADAGQTRQPDPAAADGAASPTRTGGATDPDPEDGPPAHPESAEGSGQQDPEAAAAAHERFERTLHERDPQAHPPPQGPAGATAPGPDDPQDGPYQDQAYQDQPYQGYEPATGGAEAAPHSTGVDDEDGKSWLRRMSSGRTETPEQRAYMIEAKKMSKLTAKLTFKRAPEPPPPLAPSHPLEGLAIERISTSPEGAAVIVPMISKGGTGKTTMAIETSFKTAAMTGDDGNDAPNPTARVLLIDMNLTNPDLASRVHVTGSGKTGVRDLLEGEHISRVVHRTPLPNLDVLFMLGRGDEDLDSLVGALSDPRTVQTLISAIVTSGSYDIVVVDTANTLPGIESNPASMVMTMWASIADARYLALEPEIAAFENGWQFSKRMGEAIGHDKTLVPVLNSLPLKKVYEQADIPPEHKRKRSGAFEALSYLQNSEEVPIVPGLTIKGEVLKTPLIIPSYPEEVKGFAAEGRPLSLYSESFATAYRRIVLDAVCRMLDNRKKS